MPTRSAFIRDWLERAISEETPDIEELRTGLEELDDDLPEPISDFSVVVAGAFSADDSWKMFAPVGDWSWANGALVGRVLIVGAEDTVVRDWTAIADDEAFWVGRGARFAGFDGDSDALPFAFDGKAWEDTTFDHSSCLGDWMIEIDGESLWFKLSMEDVRYASAVEGPREGVYIDAAEGGSSMVTGEIGVTMRVDSNGAFWLSLWGNEETYHGRVGRDFSPFDYLLGPFNGLVWVRSDVYDVREMRLALDQIVEDLDAWVPDAVDVRCEGFSGTAAELIAITSPEE